MLNGVTVMAIANQVVLQCLKESISSSKAWPAYLIYTAAAWC